MTAGPVPPLPGPDVPGEDPWDNRDAPEREWVPDDEELGRFGDDPRDELTEDELAGWYAELDARPAIADPEAAGCPDAGVPAGVSVFSADEAADGLGPGPLLAGLSEQAFGHGLRSLSDDALVGLLRASRRLAAWQDGVELAAVAELDARRMAAAERPESSRASEHVAEELALALVLTGRSADGLLGLARDLVRLPMVVAGLLDGTVDRPRAVVFAQELSGLDDAAARQVAGLFIAVAGSLTTGQLRVRLRALVLRLYPEAARRRAQQARGAARVEAWQELSGNGALAGRELPAADMMAADARMTAIAKALQSAGAAGTLDEVRAAVFCALLAGRDPDTLLPAPEPGPGAEPARGPAAGAGSADSRSAGADPASASPAAREGSGQTPPARSGAVADASAACDGSVGGAVAVKGSGWRRWPGRCT